MTDSAPQWVRAEGLEERVFNVRLTKGEVLRESFPKGVPVMVRLFGSRQDSTLIIKGAMRFGAVRVR